ncbi:MAG: hypothetical protein C3F15_16355 [Holophagae bacterium]|nr:MAG: hypothetical protein C3F15_16355 [Holophagae bacterium]
MSLIHEALRKARREQEEEDARGVVYARGLTGRRRRHGLGIGILLGALLTIVAGAAVGVGLWLSHGDRSGAQPPASGNAAVTPVTGASGLGPAASQPEATPLATAAAAAPAAAVPTTPALSAGSGQPPDQLTVGGDQPALSPAEHRPPPAERATPSETRGPGGERVFHVEADLGYASLVVDYIAFRPDDPFARINGVDVRVGSTVEGFTVEEITGTAVRLRDERGTVILKVP